MRCAPFDNLPIHLALERLAAGDVLVVDAAGTAAGYVGEVIATAIRARGGTGVVIDGGVRDIARLEELRFPAFARHVALRRTVKKDPGDVGAPVDIAGVRVAAGDVIVGDADGVVALSQADVDHVIEAAHAREAREREYLGRIASGELTVHLYGLRRRDGS